jgi:hypothetical protein
VWSWFEGEMIVVMNMNGIVEQNIGHRPPFLFIIYLDELASKPTAVTAGAPGAINHRGRQTSAEKAAQALIKALEKANWKWTIKGRYWK